MLLHSDEMLLSFVSEIFFFCVAHLWFQISRCPGQRLAFLPRRPAILVLSVLLTATLMCVTLSFPPSPVLHLLCLIPPFLQQRILLGRWWWGWGTGGEVDSRDPSVVCRVCLGFFFSQAPGSEWIKNSSCCSGRAVLPGSTAKGRCWALWVISAHLWDTKEHTQPSIWLALFLFL